MLPQRGELVSIGDPYPSCLVTRTCIQLTKLLNLEININNSLSQEIFNEFGSYYWHDDPRASDGIMMQHYFTDQNICSYDCSLMCIMIQKLSTKN